MKNQLLSLIASLCVLFSCAQNQKEAPIRANLKNGLAIQGYDPVAYFEQNKALKGKKEIAHSTETVTYHFSSEENKTTFLKNPSKFQPQYGGFCSFGMSKGYKAPVDPTAFTIIDEKLYLNYSHKVKEEWSINREERIKKADEYWNTEK